MKNTSLLQILLFALLSCALNTNFSTARPAESTAKYRSNLLYVRFLPEAKEFESLQSLGHSGYNVERRRLPIQNAARYSQKVFDKIVARRLSVAQVKNTEDKLLRTFLVSYTGDEDPLEKAKSLMLANPEIEHAEPVVIDELCGKFIPNDPQATQQEMFETMQVLEAWDIYKGDQTVVIGISDSGILQTHEDLADNLWINEAEIPDDGLDNDGNGYIDDYKGLNMVWQIDGSSPGSTFNSREGHGTGTAGIASALCNNEVGVAGCGFNTKFFPIKTMPDTEGGIMFGYESILYAVQMGFDVLNCSWGSLTHSDVNKSIIDYAVSCGLAIVAAAGNHGTVEPFYPACYSGVLGVGVTNPRDTVIDMSAYGAGVDIMAPGQETLTTSNDGTYGTFCCTSGAAPIVSAQVALIRGLHPELTNLQALEFARVSSDEIESKNSKHYKKLIPQRSNFLKSVQNDPFSTIAINYTDCEFHAKDNPANTRFSLDDTIQFNINFKNYLAPIDTVICRLSIVGDSLGALHAIDSVLAGGHIGTNEDFNLGDFAFSIERFSPDKPFLRVDIESGDYRDFFLVSFLPYRTFTTFSNDTLMLTACDNGKLAYNDFPNNTQGSGFKYIHSNNLLYEGAFVVTDGNGRVITQARKESNKNISDFSPNKPYLAPNENIATFTDGFAPDSMKLGVSVETMIEVPEGNSPYAQIYVKIKNTSDKPIQDISGGYFLDFDLGTARENIAVKDPDLFPPTMADGKTLAVVVSDIAAAGTLVGVAVTSNYPDVQPQFASFSAELTGGDGGFALETQHTLLNSGSKFICEDPTDIATIIGMKFPGELQPEDSVSFVITLAPADSYLHLRNTLWNALDPTVSYVETNNSAETPMIYPVPAGDELVIEMPEILSVEVLDISGRVCKDVAIDNITGDKIVLNTSNLPSGAYFVRLTNLHNIIYRNFIKK